jgi:uncharacterized protein
MRFVWDPVKEAANRRKHNIGFELATEVFFDPLNVIVLDRVVEGEERWRAFGHTEDFVLLVVAHTVLNEQ